MAENANNGQKNVPVLKLSFPITGKNFGAAGEASSRIKGTLQKIGVAPQIIRRVAIVAYETEMNIVIHADRGELTLTVNPDCIEIVAADSGAGIADRELAMQEGYSTAPDYIREMGFGAGMGLPNIKRCADKFDLQSEPGKGTTVYVRINLPG